MLARAPPTASVAWASAASRTILPAVLCDELLERHSASARPVRGRRGETFKRQWSPPQYENGWANRSRTELIKSSFLAASCSVAPRAALGTLLSTSAPQWFRQPFGVLRTHHNKRQDRALWGASPGPQCL